MNRTASPLDAARRDWLAGLASAHRRAPDAGTALALAQGEWLCGDYDEAIGDFIEAAGHAPDRTVLVAGSVVVFDDLPGYPRYGTHEPRAFDEFGSRRQTIAACLPGREVAIRIVAN